MDSKPKTFLLYTNSTKKHMLLNPNFYAFYIRFYTILLVKHLFVFLLVNTSSQSHQVYPNYWRKDLCSFRLIAPWLLNEYFFKLWSDSPKSKLSKSVLKSWFGLHVTELWIFQKKSAKAVRFVLLYCSRLESTWIP